MSVNDETFSIDNKDNYDGVVYTCITGSYDDLLEQKYKLPNYRYICFTDSEALLNEKLSNGWEIYPLVYSQSDNTRNNRWHKIHPHCLFKDYKQSVYIDSNINVLTEKLYNIISSSEKDLLIPEHFSRNCIYEECNECLILDKDIPEKIHAMIKLMQKDNMPQNYGLNENNIIFRRHHNPTVIKIMEDWWSFIENYSRRDQLSLAYVLWKNGIKPSDIAIENARLDEKNYLFKKHNNDKSGVANKKLNFWQQLFSLTTIHGHKQICILGIKLKIKRVKKK